MISQEIDFKKKPKITAGEQPINTKRIFASNLLYLRSQAGLSIREVSEKMAIEHTRYATWERAESTPNYDFLVFISRFFNVTIDTLLTTYLVENE